MGRKKGNQDSLVRNREPSTSMHTRKSKSDQQTEISTKVFNNPLLMEKIMKYSIYKFNGKEIDTKAVTAIRLVNKSWLQTASHILKNSGDWLISLKIGGLYEIYRRHNGVVLDKKEALLHNFVSVFSQASHSIDSIIPIHLDILQYFLVEDNCAKLRNFFEQFGDIISSLCITYPLNGDGGLMNFKCNNLNFPILQTVDFGFEIWRDPLSNLRRAAEATTQNNTNGLSFLQQILNNSANLQIIAFGQDDDEATVDISSTSLPKSVKKLRLGSPLTCNELTLVTNNILPKLDTLDLEIGKESEVSLVYKILERFGPQLKTLLLSASLEDDLRIIVKLPLMAKLTHLKLVGVEDPLLPQLIPNLVPSLTHLIFQQQLSESMFLDLIRGSRFENVKKLKFSLIEDDEESYNIMSPSVQIIKKVIASFPNIEKLTLKYVLNDISSLKYLFQNLPLLKKLDLSFEPHDDEYDDDDDDSSHQSYKLVSVFLGISLELATALVDKTAKNVNVAFDNPESIMNLTELSSLTLHLPPPYTYLLKNGRNPGIISKHGLDKMPKLQNVKL